jgi:hypothetical protein
VLFLLRPPQSQVQLGSPRDAHGHADQSSLQSYASTRRVDTREAAGADDLVASLRGLASLRDAGALTEDEFSAAKAKVLGRSEA